MELFFGLAVVLVVAAGAGIVARALKQPALLGYVVAGVLVARFSGYNEIEGLVEVLGSLGVTLLLFLVGLELPIGEIKRMGKVALATGLGQIIFTAGIGFFLIRLMGFDTAAAIYLSIALAFSSTIIIIKLLSEKRDLNSLYGRIAVGFLLVQDFVAIGILVALSGLSETGWSWLNLGWVGIKGIVLVGLTMVLATYLIPKAIKWIAGSTEILFVTSIAWCLGVAALVASPMVGFGIEIGGFLAGLAIANSSQNLQILARTRPLRDFFLTLFFVSLGTSISVSDVGSIWWPAAVLSLFVLIGNPLIVMAIMGVMGFKKRTGFLAGLTVAQISEFSLIVMALAVKVGHVRSEALALTTVVGVITMTASTYMILYGDRLYRFFAPYISIFEKRNAREKSHSKSVLARQSEIILFGLGRTGQAMLPALAKLGFVAIVDFDPQVSDGEGNENTQTYHGDMGDYEVIDELGMDKAKLVVSTVPSEEDNLALLTYLKEKKSRPTVIVTAGDDRWAEKMYKTGADYVLVPNRIGGEYLAHIFKHHGLDPEHIQIRGQKHMEALKI